MKNALNLVKASWDLKKNIQKCLRHAEDSQEYILANYYEAYFNGLKDENVNSAHIDTLVIEVKEKQIEHQEREDVQGLLSSILRFLESLRSMEM